MINKTVENQEFFPNILYTNEACLTQNGIFSFHILLRKQFLCYRATQVPLEIFNKYVNCYGYNKILVGPFILPVRLHLQNYRNGSYMRLAWSPDLNPLGFYFLGHAKDILNCHSNKDNLRCRIFVVPSVPHLKILKKLLDNWIHKCNV